MTIVFFVRHAQPNYNNHDDLERELTEKGLRDRLLVTEFLWDKHVDAVLSSPYVRAVETVKDFADKAGLPIKRIEDFRERKIDRVWIEDFDGFCRRQWADFDYKLSDGETLRQVQNRNIAALRGVLKEYRGKTVVVGSHGTALSTIIHNFDSSFGYEEFEKIRTLMPWVVKFTFQGECCTEIQKIDLFSL